MEKRTLEAIEAELNNAVNQRTKAAADLNNHIKTAKEAAIKARGHLATAQEAGEPKAYAAAAAQDRAAQDVLKMYTDKLTALEATTPLTGTQYDETRKKIMDHLEEVAANNHNELMDIFKRLEAIRDDLNTEINHGDSLLRMLQRNIMQRSKSTHWKDDEFRNLDMRFFINDTLSRGSYLKELK